jgi:hypothetical protein
MKELIRATEMGEGVEVLADCARKIGDNGKYGDQRKTAYVAPSSTSDEMYVYISDNGDMVYLGYMDEGGEIVIDDSNSLAREAFEENREWLEPLRWRRPFVGGRVAKGEGAA